jgi:hypothetical protein
MQDEAQSEKVPAGLYRVTLAKAMPFLLAAASFGFAAALIVRHPAMFGAMPMRAS